LADDKRQALLQSTVRAVAKYGMKDVSIRSISADAGVNDAYIYRYFKDKEDLLVQAYLLENDRFMRHVMRCIELVQEQAALQEGIRDRYCIIFHTAWRYLLDTPDVCRFFMYYYHSPNFEKYAQETYKEQLDLLAGKIIRLFDCAEDARHCLYALFVLLNSCSIQVLNGELPDNAETEDRVYRMTYNAICAQMKNTEPENVSGK
jgi:AcrR family transcriptional regulator